MKKKFGNKKPILIIILIHFSDIIKYYHIKANNKTFFIK